MSARRSLLSVVVAAALALAAVVGVGAAAADETCNSPYIAKLIKGQEDYVYVWALGVEGVGDGSDKLVTIDVNPKSKTYGKVLARCRSAPAARRTTWASPTTGASSGPAGWTEPKIYVFDIAHRSGQAQAREDDRRHGRQVGLLGPAHLLRAAGPDAGAGAVEHEGQGRRHRDGALQQQG